MTTEEKHMKMADEQKKEEDVLLERVQWVEVSEDDGYWRIEPIEPTPPNDKSAAWQFAQDMAAEMASIITIPQSIERTAAAAATRFLVDWCPWRFEDAELPPTHERRAKAQQWLHHMIASCRVESDPMAPAFRRALKTIGLFLVGDDTDVPSELREWADEWAGEQFRRAREQIPQAGPGRGNSPKRKIASEARAQRVCVIVEMMAAHAVLKGVILVTRNDAADPRRSICDAVAEALTNAGQPTTYEAARKAWDHRRRMRNALRTLPPPDYPLWERERLSRSYDTCGLFVP